MNKSMIWAPIAVIAGLALSWFVTTGEFNNPQQSSELRQAPTGGDFTLSGAQGPYSLEDSRGKVVLIYFGYTFCPDICPTNLALMSQALNELEAEELKHVQGLFVSIDPERDTPKQLADYTDMFHDSILGVTGEPEKVRVIAKSYGSAYNKVEGQSEAGYLVDHTSYTYVVAPDGSLSEALPHAAPPEQILDSVRSLLAKKSS